MPTVCLMKDEEEATRDEEDTPELGPTTSLDWAREPKRDDDEEEEELGRGGTKQKREGEKGEGRCESVCEHVRRVVCVCVCARVVCVCVCPLC